MAAFLSSSGAVDADSSRGNSSRGSLMILSFATGVVAASAVFYMRSRRLSSSSSSSSSSSTLPPPPTTRAIATTAIGILLRQTEGDNDDATAKMTNTNHTDSNHDAAAATVAADDEYVSVSENEDATRSQKNTAVVSNEATDGTAALLELPLQQQQQQPAPTRRTKWPWDRLKKGKGTAESSPSPPSPSAAPYQQQQQAVVNPDAMTKNIIGSSQTLLESVSPSSLPNGNNLLPDDDDDDDDADGGDGEAAAAAAADDKEEEDRKSSLCIGSIFGLDVGGTLAKLCYFETTAAILGSSSTSAGSSSHDEYLDHPADSFGLPSHHHGRESLYRARASAQAVCMARRRRDDDDDDVKTVPHHRPRNSCYARTTAACAPLHHGDDDDTALGRQQHHRRILVGQGRQRPRSKSMSSSNHESAPAWTDSNSKIANVVSDAGSQSFDECKTTPLLQPHSPQLPSVDVEQQHPQQRHHHHYHSQESDEDLENMHKLRQESVPDDLHAYAQAAAIAVPNTMFRPNTKHGVSTTTTTPKFPNDNDEEENDPIDAPKNSRSATTGGIIDSAASQQKIRRARSMFDLSFTNSRRDHAEALDRFYNFARRLDSYREGVRDHKLSFYSNELGGEFHFIRFETRRMQNAMDLIRAHKLHLNIHEMGGTGGGAHKFAAVWKQELGISMKKQDELDSLVAGMQFVLSTVVGECYTFRPPKDPSSSSQSSSKAAPPAAAKKAPDSDYGNYVGIALDEDETEGNVSEDELPWDEKDRGQGDEWWWSRKVQRDCISSSSTYPYLVVTIGTGVSVLRVDGPRKYERVSGSTIGGGTYLGLIRLLTDVEDFDDVMRLAERGDPSKVDMMVGDIYGENSDALEKLGLPSNLVASSFGKLVAKEDPAAGLKQEDLARALLLMITNNIGQVAHLNAKLFKTPRIYFVGNFLRHNKISQRRLSYAINYWSKGEMEALFLKHEGYFGALGAFLLAQDISVADTARRNHQKPAAAVRSPSVEEAEYVAHTRANASEK